MSDQCRYKEAAILIVDDQPPNVELLVTILRADGYTRFTTTTDSREAARLFETVKPDLVLLDLQMPHLDGFDVMRQLRERLAPDEYLPILVLTANATAEVKQRALSGGARDFLAKPLDRIEVLLRIKNLLETRLLHREIHDRNRALEDTVRALEMEREVSEKLLLNVLPKCVADRLRQEQGIIADSFSEATVLFADIVNFAPICAQLTAEQVVAWLNGIFSVFDQLAAKHGLEKIKTIGDSYMVAGGIPSPRGDHAEAVADLALDLRDAIGAHVSPTGARVGMRIGMHSGQVVAGVIGTHKFSYDLWGETVNTASRMESHGIDGAIQVSEATWLRLRDSYEFEERGVINLKGGSAQRTYLLTGRKTGG